MVLKWFRCAPTLHRDSAIIIRNHQAEDRFALRLRSCGVLRLPYGISQYPLSIRSRLAEPLSPSPLRIGPLHTTHVWLARHHDLFSITLEDQIADAAADVPKPGVQSHRCHVCMTLFDGKKFPWRQANY